MAPDVGRPRLGRFRRRDSPHGPWGQGPPLLLALRILDALGVGDLDSGSSAWARAVVEALKLSLADP